VIDLRSRGVGAIVVDIEGTTTPIAFVHDTLFAYARVRLDAFLRDHWDVPEVVRARDLLRNEADMTAPASAARDLSIQMAEDRKSPGLKLIQGLIWEGGYDAGELRGQVYPDVAPALRRWHGAGRVLAVYSSGSELAQRRLFQSTPEGDLTPLFAAFFDTAVGPKREAASYLRIAAALGVDPRAVLFVSDVTAELAAARLASCQPVLCVRPANPAQPDALEFDRIDTFAALV
jgi:enolase-phosphatase E1